MRILLTTLSLLVGIVLFLVSWSLVSTGPEPNGDEIRRVEPVSPRLEPGDDRRSAQSSFEDRPTLEEEERSWPSLAEALALLEEDFVVRFYEAWSKYRDDSPTEATVLEARAEFLKRLEELPDRVARSLASDLTEAEEYRRTLEEGDAQRLLEIADQNRIEFELDELERKLEHFVAPRLKTQAVNGEALDKKAKLESGMTIRFGRGVHPFAPKLRSQTATPSDLTLSGVGIDETVLIVDRNFVSNGDWERIRIENLTIFTSSSELFTAYSGQLVLDLDSVRLLGWDSGAGGSNLFEAKGLFIRARDTEFLGGYGRSPGFGNLIRGGPIFGVLESCLFEGFDSKLRGSGHRVVYRNCHFDAVEHDPRKRISNRSRVAFEACTFGEDLQARREEKRKLEELLPHLF